jgi:hypothetical protein
MRLRLKWWLTGQRYYQGWPTPFARLGREVQNGRQESREKGLLTLNFYAVFCALEMLQSGSGRTGDYEIDVLVKDTPPYGDFR